MRRSTKKNSIEHWYLQKAGGRIDSQHIAKPGISCVGAEVQIHQPFANTPALCVMATSLKCRVVTIVFTF